MNLQQYLGKEIRVTFVDGQVIQGLCNGYTNKQDTDDELYDEVTIQTDKYPFVGFNESEIKSIKVIKK